MVRVISKRVRKIKHKTIVLRHRYLDRFEFIHINKTGGTSVCQALNIALEHKTAVEKIQEIGRQTWDQRLTFATVRNPWDKVVSHYHHRLQSDHTDLAANPIGFKEWVTRAYRDHDPAYYNNPKLYMPQLAWISDPEGNVLVDEVLRFERFAEDFKQIAKKLNREIELPHVRKSKRGDYRSYYDTATVDVVAGVFARDIAAFGYRFE